MKKYLYFLVCISLLLSGCSKSSEPVKGNPDPLIGVVTANGERLTSKEDYERAILNVNGSVQADTEWGNIENSSGGLQQAAYDFGAKVAEVAAVKAIVEETLDNYTDETYSTEFHDSYGVVNIPDIDEEQADKYTQAFNIAASELGIEDYQITVNPVETVPDTTYTEFNYSGIPSGLTMDSLVWVSDKGTKYHSTEECSNMRINPTQIPLRSALANGREACSKCW